MNFGQRLSVRMVHHCFLRRHPEDTQSTCVCPTKGVKNQACSAEPFSSQQFLVFI